MSDLLHKTLKSYHNNSPWAANEEHPDGLLWLITPEELEDIPNGITLDTINGQQVVKGRDSIEEAHTKNGYLPFGLRGR